MTINKNNFESAMLDYLEGNLDPLLTADLMAFLAENPEFEKFMPDYDGSMSLHGSSPFVDKFLLKKDFADIPDITPENFDEFCIADCEGLLTETDRQRLRDYISGNPERLKEWEIYRKIKLHPDKSIAFSGKSDLKKRFGHPLRMRSLYYSLAFAATLAFIVLLAVRNKPDHDFTVNQTAISESSKSRMPSPVSVAQDEPAIQHVEKPASKIQPSRRITANLVTVEPESIEPVREQMVLNALKPLAAPSIRMEKEISPLTALRTKTFQIQSSPANSYKRIPGDSFADTFLGSFIARVDFWKTAETAIQGFNYLTEANVSIDKTTDENGKMNGLLLSMESYRISGIKMK